MAVRAEKNGAVWTIIHDRPEARNAMDPKSADALTAAFLEFDADKYASVAVFYGAGGAFCAGWDLKFVSTLDSEYPLGELDIPPAGPRRNGGEIPRGPLGPSRLELDKPVIAAIEGPAVAGGMELGLWCDFRVMAEGSYFGVYCRRWGVPLIDGGTVRLPRIVGQGRALEIILTGRKVPAEECLNIGLCEYVTPKGRAREKAEELAKEIARFPQTCVRASRLAKVALRTASGSRRRSSPSSSSRSKPYARVMAPVADAIEARDAVLAARDRLAVDDAGSRAQLRQRPDDQREAIGQVVARPAVEPHPLAILAGDDPKPIVLDFVQPQGSGRRLWGRGG
jgi:enoyl-CoA hydratase